jgi:hypothetical protein
MDQTPNVSCLILKQDEVCPYESMCPFNTGAEKCYGSLERDNEFICNLDELRLMYSIRHKNPLCSTN